MKKLVCLLFLSMPILAQESYYFGTEKYNNTIPAPEKFFNYNIGDLHTRYDQMLSYFKELDRLSDHMKIESMGHTNEFREQVLLVISTPENIGKLEEIRQNHLLLAQGKLKPGANTPVIIWLGYNVHGNEPSGGEASILTAYKLLASENIEVKNWLKNAIILIEPVINPDGRDRHTTWVNSHKSIDRVADKYDREHNEAWPQGRTNHYWFDLNRDWYLATQIESQNRLKHYHRWLPNVVTDFHEMGTNATHFFEPSKENAENPLVPKEVYRSFNLTFAKYFQKTMDEQGSLYYTKESFDNFYPGYGSSYPDIQGGLGLLFEQASSRGHAQESQHGILQFSFTIKNQYNNALATIRAGIDNKTQLLNHQFSFFNKVISDAKTSSIKAYIVGDEYDNNKLRAFQKLLMRHEIEFFELKNDQKIDNQMYSKGKALLIPTAQAQNLLIKSIFERPKVFADSLFYDASTWNLALSYNLNHKALNEIPVLGEIITKIKDLNSDFNKSNYAYLVPYTDYLGPKFIQLCHKNNILVKSAFKKFGIGGREYGYGTLLIPVQYQKISEDSLYRLLKDIQTKSNIEIISTNTGLSSSGVDLGSNAFNTLQKPKAAIIVGQGVSPYEVGYIWHLTDVKIGLPITKIDINSFNNVPINQYNTLILVNGNYGSLDKNKLKTWVQNGGTLIAQKNAIDYLVKSELIKEKLLEPKTDTSKTTYENYPNLLGAKNTGGAIFQTQVDLSHPLLFGYTADKLPVYRNGNTIMTKASLNINSPITYTQEPWLCGYVHKSTLKRLGGSAAASVSYDGYGRYVLFTDDLNFRATWHGTNKVFLNAIFFGSLLTKPGGAEGEEE